MSVCCWFFSCFCFVFLRLQLNSINELKLYRVCVCVCIPKSFVCVPGAWKWTKFSWNMKMFHNISCMMMMMMIINKYLYHQHHHISTWKLCIHMCDIKTKQNKTKKRSLFFIKWTHTHTKTPVWIAKMEKKQNL